MMRFARFTFQPLVGLLGLSIAALISWAISHWTDLPFWGAFAIVFGAMFINGVIADREDNAPGGFNNPLPDSIEEDKEMKTKAAQPGATDNPDDAQRLREDH